MNPMVTLAGVDKVFPARKGSSTVALKGIDLEVEAGEFVSLLGPSGCGKSTLLRIVGDLLTPTSGIVTVNGKTAAEARQDRDYGMVFQQATLLEWRRVLRNVALPLEITGVSDAEREQRARAMLELVELTEFADHYPWQLSGGMQQRVAIALGLTFVGIVALIERWLIPPARRVQS